MKVSNAFQLSRVYGEGWNAAKKLLAGGLVEVDETSAAALNPYRSDEENIRWSEGFNAALARPMRSFNTPGGSSWRAAGK